MEATNTKFVPDCIKSSFLHSFIIVQVDVESNPNLYTVSCLLFSGILKKGYCSLQNYCVAEIVWLCQCSP